MGATSHTCVLSLRRVGVAYRQGGLSLRRRPRFWVLEEVSFDLFAGETLGVIGRNAAGKSTLLRLLAGIIRSDRGRLIGFGRSAALLSLQAGFLPHLTGRENAVLSGLLLGLRRAEIEGRLPEILRFSELGDFFEQPLGNYSAGMKARLGFAVAYQADPEILLIDEVLGVGDAAFQQKSQAAMRERICSNRTVVLVSHNAASIRALCDRAIWLDEGVIKADGPVDQVLARYQADGAPAGGAQGQVPVRHLPA